MKTNFIKDVNGKVLTLYHGTPNAGFTEFSEKYFGTRTHHSKDAVGFHFTDNPEYANTYAKTIEIKMELAYEKFFNEKSKSYDNLPKSAIIPVYLKMNNPMTLNMSKEINAESIAKAKENGFDGIIASHGTGMEYVVFNKEQICFKYLTKIS